MTALGSSLGIVAYMAAFATVGFVFLFANLLVGRLLRPSNPHAEKLEIYECGEPTIGSSFVQFDLRFYVVALLFIIFDVEVAFFFPWATVFGKATQLSSPDMPVVMADVDPAGSPTELSPQAAERLRELGVATPTIPALSPARARELNVGGDPADISRAAVQDTARKIAITSLWDIGVFFAVLMVGFAY